MANDAGQLLHAAWGRRCHGSDRDLPTSKYRAHPCMDVPSALPITVPVLARPDVRLCPFRHQDASWVYYVSLDPELRRRLSLPDPYHRLARPYFVDEIAIAAAGTGEGADFVIEDPDTEIGLGWVGFHHRKGTEVSCGFWLAADVRGRGLTTFLARRGGADRPIPQRPPEPTAG